MQQASKDIAFESDVSMSHILKITKFYLTRLSGILRQKPSVEVNFVNSCSPVKIVDFHLDFAFSSNHYTIGSPQSFTQLSMPVCNFPFSKDAL